MSETIPVTPQDVWKIAWKIADECVSAIATYAPTTDVAGNAGWSHAVMRGIIARAIIAERERAAKIAEETPRQLIADLGYYQTRFPDMELLFDRIFREYSKIAKGIRNAS